MRKLETDVQAGLKMILARFIESTDNVTIFMLLKLFWVSQAKEKFIFHFDIMTMQNDRLNKKLKRKTKAAVEAEQTEIAVKL